jgi:hypothetical protein
MNVFYNSGIVFFFSLSSLSRFLLVVALGVVSHLSGILKDKDKDWRIRIPTTTPLITDPRRTLIYLALTLVELKRASTIYRMLGPRIPSNSFDPDKNSQIVVAAA